MLINVTSIRLRSLWGYFPLTYNAMHIVRQIKSQPGFVRMKNTGVGYNHYTLSVWQDENSMKAFARTGAHLEAMKIGASLAHEIRTLSYYGDEVPSWREVKAMLKEKGRVISYN